MGKKVKYLSNVGLIGTAKESKILPDCGEKQSCYVCEKAAECKQKKIEADADEFKKKYPEIAKMTVAEVVNTDGFTSCLNKAIKSIKIGPSMKAIYYALQSLRNTDKVLTDLDKFKAEYLACLDKESKLPAIKRNIIVSLGNEAYRNTVTNMMKEYDTNRK